MMKTFMTTIAAARRLLAAAAQRVRNAVGPAVDRIRALWAAHEALMDTNDLYNALVTAAAYALARRTSARRGVLAVLSAALTAYARTRGRHGPGGTQPPSRYDDDPDGWSFA